MSKKAITLTKSQLKKAVQKEVQKELHKRDLVRQVINRKKNSYEAALKRLYSYFPEEALRAKGVEA